MLQPSRLGFCSLSRFPFLMLPVIWTLHIIDQIISPLRFFRSLRSDCTLRTQLHAELLIVMSMSHCVCRSFLFLQSFNDFFPVLHPFHWRLTGIDQKGNILFILSLNLNLFCHEQSPFVSYCILYNFVYLFLKYTSRI